MRPIGSRRSHREARRRPEGNPEHLDRPRAGYQQVHRGRRRAGSTGIQDRLNHWQRGYLRGRSRLDTLSPSTAKCLCQRLEHGRVIWRRQIDDRQIKTLGTQGGRFVHDPCVIAIRAQTNVSRQGDLLRITPDVRAVRGQHFTFTGEFFGRPAHEVPMLGVPGGDAQCSLLPLPPMQIGGCGFCGPFGSLRASLS